MSEFCVIIPVYNHPDTIGVTVKEVRALHLPVVAWRNTIGLC